MGLHDADALVIGGGPAGASCAIRLARAGWRVMLIEQSCYPRQKVCGECLGVACLQLLDDIGIGEQLRGLAGPEIRQVGWMTRTRTVIAPMPACNTGSHRYGRAIGRDTLDHLLLERARAVGVQIIQPARVRSISGAPGDFTCEYSWRTREDRAEVGTNDRCGSRHRRPRLLGTSACRPDWRLPRSSQRGTLRGLARFQGQLLECGVAAGLAAIAGVARRLRWHGDRGSRSHHRRLLPAARCLTPVSPQRFE